MLHYAHEFQSSHFPKANCLSVISLATRKFAQQQLHFEVEEEGKKTKSVKPKDEAKIQLKSNIK